MITRYDIQSYDRYDRPFTVNSRCKDVSVDENGVWAEWEDIEYEFDWRAEMAREGDLAPLNELLSEILGEEVSISIDFCE